MEMTGANILLVDDDEINRLVATTFLRKWSVSVTVATNGLEAIEQIKSKKFQLVMMDLHMPEMDGYECTRRIRQMDDSYFKTVPIVVFSAAYTIDSKQKAMEHGMTDFMNKPFRHEELQEKLAAYIARPDGDKMVTSSRPLNIDFDTHTDGDPVFKVELIQLLMENIAELRSTLAEALRTNQSTNFLKVCHKVLTAVTMLNDAEFLQSFDEARSFAKDNTNLSEGMFIKLAARLDRICEEVFKSLERESNHTKKAL